MRAGCPRSAPAVRPVRRRNARNSLPTPRASHAAFDLRADFLEFLADLRAAACNVRAPAQASARPSAACTRCVARSACARIVSERLRGLRARLPRELRPRAVGEQRRRTWRVRFSISCWRASIPACRIGRIQLHADARDDMAGLDDERAACRQLRARRERATSSATYTLPSQSFSTARMPASSMRTSDSTGRRPATPAVAGRGRRVERELRGRCVGGKAFTQSRFDSSAARRSRSTSSAASQPASTCSFFHRRGSAPSSCLSSHGCTCLRSEHFPAAASARRDAPRAGGSARLRPARAPARHGVRHRGAAPFPARRRGAPALGDLFLLGELQRSSSSLVRRVGRLLRSSGAHGAAAAAGAAGRRCAGARLRASATVLVCAIRARSSLSCACASRNSLRAPAAHRASRRRCLRRARPSRRPSRALPRLPRARPAPSRPARYCSRCAFSAAICACTRLRDSTMNLISASRRLTSAFAS